MDEAIKNFNAAHQAYHGQLEDQTEIDDSQEYYDATLLLANDTRRIIDDWLQVGFEQPQGAIGQPNLQPEDSVNNIGSRIASKSKTRSKASSRSSRSSSVCGARVAAAAKRASLAAEVRQWRKFCAWRKGAAGGDRGLESTQDRGISTTAKREMDIQPSWRVSSWRSLGTLHKDGEESHGRPHKRADPRRRRFGNLNVRGGVYR